LRRFLGLTQLDLEIATGIPVRRISLAENGSIRLTGPEESAVFEYLADRLRIVKELEAAHVSDRAPRAVRVPEIHRAPGEFDQLPDELPDPSLDWIENPERRRG
jgi:hypothetical protein